MGLKIVVLGPSKTRKTNLVKKLLCTGKDPTLQDITTQDLPTIGVNLYKTHTIGKKTSDEEIMIWDVGSQCHTCQINAYTRGCDVAFIIYDPASKTSGFNNIGEFISVAEFFRDPYRAKIALYDEKHDIDDGLLKIHRSQSKQMDFDFMKFTYSDFSSIQEIMGTYIIDLHRAKKLGFREPRVSCTNSGCVCM